MGKLLDAHKNALFTLFALYKIKRKNEAQR